MSKVVLLGSAKSTIPIPDRPALIGFNQPGDLDPAQAKLNLQLAQAQRDHGNLSSAELAKVERALGVSARKARTLYNPFTGEIRREFV